MPRPMCSPSRGYDAAQLFAAGLNAVKGDTKKKAEMIKAMENAKLESPRGPLSFSKSHNPIQDLYARVVTGSQNVMTDVIVKALADPSPDCKI